MRKMFVLALLLFVNVFSISSFAQRACSEYEITQLTRQYLAYSTISHPESVRLANLIQTKLNESYTQGGELCFQHVSTASLYTTLKYIENNQFADRPFIDNPNVIPLSDILLNYLSSYNLFRPMNSKLRTSMQGMWLQKNANSSYTHIGAYDCTNQQVYVDMEHDPLNVAGIFIHEVSHLLFDRLAPQLEINNTERKLLDESLAVIFAGVNQVNLLSYALKSPLQHRISDIHNSNKKDMTLFQKDGPLYKNWQSYIMQKQPDIQIYMTSFLLSESFLITTGNKSNLRELFKNVGSVYLTSEEASKTTMFLDRAIELNHTNHFLSQIYSQQMVERLRNLPRIPTSSCNGIRHGNDGVRTEDSVIRACIHHPRAY